jgi:hypothetical protein
MEDGGDGNQADDHPRKPAEGGFPKFIHWMSLTGKTQQK